MEYLDKARRDFLTGCFAKEEIDEILNRVRAECNIYKRSFSILVLDIDHFKAYNDKYGHLDGDEVLKYFASTLRLSFTEGECIPVRFGGDEFIIIFPGKGVGEAHSLVNSFSHSLQKRPFLMRGRVFNMGFSGGIVSYPSDGTETEDLLQKADKAMYYSKTHGRGRTTYYSSMRSKAFRHSIIIILIGLAITSLSYYMLYSGRGRIGEVAIRVRRGINTMLAPSAADKRSSATDQVYMKSGRVFSGKIIRETKNSIEFRLHLATGEGSIVIDRSDIGRIEKGAEKPAPVAEKK